MTIHNLASTQNAYRSMMMNRVYGAQSINKLASGYRVNSARDDAAGLAISEMMRGQVRGLDRASENAQHGISMVQTAEGSVSSAGDIMNRMRELAVQASNGTYSSSDREMLSQEFNNLKSELTRISDSANYNGQKLLDGTLGGKSGEAGLAQQGISGITANGNLSGQVKFDITEENGTYSITARMGDESVTQQIAAGAQGATFNFGGGDISLGFSNGVSGLAEGVIGGVAVDGANVDVRNAVSASNADGVTFQIGANGGADQRLSLQIGDMSARGLGIENLDISAIDGANAAIGRLTQAIDQNSSARSSLGAIQNRLTHSVNNLGVTRENLTASESRIRDLDMAREAMNLTQRNIMMQASQSMMAQSMNLARSQMMAFLVR